ncbi:hypothetical protein V8C26DRAFT_404901 [Trichoderma gracile]
MSEARSISPRKFGTFCLFLCMTSPSFAVVAPGWAGPPTPSKTKRRARPRRDRTRQDETGQGCGSAEPQSLATNPRPANPRLVFRCS